jgi:hypothetical protein
MAEFNMSDRTCSTTGAEEHFLSTRVRFRFSVMIFLFILSIYMYMSSNCQFRFGMSSTILALKRCPVRLYSNLICIDFLYILVSYGFNVFWFACVCVGYFLCCDEMLDIVI